MSSTPTSTTTSGGRTVAVVVVDPDGSSRQERWTTAADGGLLEQLQRAVGGLVDVVALSEHVDLWVNDEGLYLCEPNPVATLLAVAYGRTRQPYFGPAVFTGGADSNGATLSLQPELAAQLSAAAERARTDVVTLTAVRSHSERFAAAYR